MPSAELKSLGERKGWTMHELSMREIRQMSADETSWHEAYNKENFDGAIERDANARHNRQAMGVWDIRRQWREGVTEEQSRRAQEAGAEFARRFPTFEQSIDNAHAIVGFMEENDLDPTEIASYVTAYRELTDQGKLTVAPAESADDYLRNHPELHERRTPPIIAARAAKAEQTAKYFQAAANATAKGTVVSFTDYPERERIGYGDHTRYSFRKLLDSLDAESYARRLKDDPQFSAALDKLNDGK